MDDHLLDERAEDEQGIPRRGRLRSGWPGLVALVFWGGLFSLGARDVRSQETDRVLADERLEDLELVQVIALKGELHHVQGIEIEGDRLWVTSVDRGARTGHLDLFELPSGEAIRSVEVHDGEKYHPGGIAADETAIWVPVAPYQRTGVSYIERRDKETLELIDRFSVDDHIGCLAVDGERVIGGNWDTRLLYTWDKEGNLLRKQPNPTPNHYQDMKIRDGRLVGSGKIPGRGGAVDWLDIETLELERRVRGGATDRGVSFMNEGMTIRDGKLYLLPEDGPSRLFIFRLD